MQQSVEQHKAIHVCFHLCVVVTSSSKDHTGKCMLQKGLLKHVCQEKDAQITQLSSTSCHWGSAFERHQSVHESVAAICFAHILSPISAYLCLLSAKSEHAPTTSGSRCIAVSTSCNPHNTTAHPTWLCCIGDCQARCTCCDCVL